MKIRVATSEGQIGSFTPADGNLFLEIEDTNGRTHFLGSLYITRDVFGAVSAELGSPFDRAGNELGDWTLQNPVSVFNQSLHYQYRTPDRGGH